MKNNNFRPIRPVLKYPGGKWMLADWIISHFPRHETYCEPFAGAASVLLSKPRAPEEIYNDLDGKILNVFRVLRNKQKSEELIRQLDLTPFSRKELENAHNDVSTEDIDLARNIIVLSFFGFGTDSVTGKNKPGFAPDYIKKWTTYTRDINLAIERLQGVVFENRPAIKAIRKYDSVDTLFYLDPPYFLEGKDPKHAFYRYQMSEEGHVELADMLNSIEGMAVLSGYRSKLYKRLYKGWKCKEKGVMATAAKGGSKPAMECLWISTAAAKAPPIYVWRG